MSGRKSCPVCGNVKKYKKLGDGLYGCAVCHFTNKRFGV